MRGHKILYKAFTEHFFSTIYHLSDKFWSR